MGVVDKREKKKRTLRVFVGSHKKGVVLKRGKETKEERVRICAWGHTKMGAGKERDQKKRRRSEGSR